MGEEVLIRKPRKLAKVIAIFGILASLCITASLALLGQNVSAVIPNTPAPIPTSIVFGHIPINGSDAVDFQTIDALLRQSIPGSIAYNAPTPTSTATWTGLYRP